MLIRCPGADLPAILTLPREECRGSVVLLHPANDPSRRQYLFKHLSMILPGHGMAVLRYDRRTAEPGRDVPYEVQAEDLAHARQTLAQHTGPVPAGLWGFSQGASVALLAAARRRDISFLVTVGCSAVSPARQMRYGTAQQLRRAGYGPNAMAGLDELRTAWEAYHRGQLGRPQAQRIVDAHADRPWFGLSWVPRVLPAAPGWEDLDFDPAECISAIRCPALAFYGTDEWVPVPESMRAWRREYAGPRLDIEALPGTTHHPTLDGRREVAAISPRYTASLTGWLDDVLAGEKR